MITLITCLIGGLGAGIGTGLAGLSAAAVISPMLITFLGIPSGWDCTSIRCTSKCCVSLYLW